MVRGFEEGAVAMRGGGGRVAQCSGEVGVTLAGADRLGLTGAFIVAGSNADPGGKVPDGREGGKVDADLGNDDSSREPVDAGNGLQQFDMVFVRRQKRRDLLVKNGDISLGSLDASKLHGKQTSPMAVKVDRQCL